MKKLAIVLMVMATLSSCGKNNQVGSNINSSTAGLSSSVAGAIETELASKINNNQFGTQQATMYETFQQLVTHYPAVKYTFGDVTVSTSTPKQECLKVGGVPLLCASWSGSSSISGSPLSNVSTVFHSSITDDSKKSELIGLINKRAGVRKDSYYPNIYYIVTTDSKIHTIDTGVPLQANPVSVEDTVAKTRRVFYSWSTF